MTGQFRCAVAGCLTGFPLYGSWKKEHEATPHVHASRPAGSRLLVVALSAGARQTVLDLLRSLPGDRQFSAVRDVWAYLSNVPIDHG
jgi:hypothetical protein